MEKILLVEPNYKNKYPPIGLMKISTYYKQKGDFVQFIKGLLPSYEVKKFNKVLITTLFTFDFDICIKTINYYVDLVGIENVYVGGIAATILPKKFKAINPSLNLIERQLYSSILLGYNDNINIDKLELDYDILYDTNYKYEEDSYFIYTSRGCPRKCSFCGVRILEPEFYDCNNIIEQIHNIDKKFGIKKKLLIMDNNILNSSNFNLLIKDLKALGFSKKNNKIKKNNIIPYYISSLKERIKINKNYYYLLERLKKELIEKKSLGKTPIALEIIADIKNIVDSTSLASYIIAKEDIIVNLSNKSNHYFIKRYVDFNQGLDARLFTDNKAMLLGEIALNPCRIAFDNISLKEDYFNALNLAVKNNILHFSNYILYNYNDKPEDLWERLYLNVKFNNKIKEIYNYTHLYSFPMKYADINATNRNFIGQNWNKKFLQSINVLLHITSGIVAKEEDFFKNIFGNNKEEFLEILAMPDDFIRYRKFFTDQGF